jgi:hypothetical protein
MYYIHHFAHHETLRRACDWLGRFGFEPDLRDGSPWLMLQVDPSQIAKVELLVNAVEQADPAGWPSFWDEARSSYSSPSLSSTSSGEGQTASSRASIGWHPIDKAVSLAMPDLERIHRAMGH